MIRRVIIWLGLIVVGTACVFFLSPGRNHYELSQFWPKLSSGWQHSYEAYNFESSFTRITFFPLRAPLEVRHRWALNQFPISYQTALNYVARSTTIRDDVGEPLSIAPVPNAANGEKLEHEFYYWVYSLEVIGPNGEGTCKLQLQNRDSSEIKSAEWKYDNQWRHLSLK